MKRHKEGGLPSLDRRPAFGDNSRPAALRAAQRQRTQLAARATPLVPPVPAGRAAGVRGAETPAPLLFCLACDRLAEDGWPEGTGPHFVCRACADLDELDGNPDKEYDAWVDAQMGGVQR